MLISKVFLLKLDASFQGYFCVHTWLAQTALQWDNNCPCSGKFCPTFISAIQKCVFQCWFPQNSTKNKKELAASRNEYLKAKKEKKKAKWAEIEKEVG